MFLLPVSPAAGPQVCSVEMGTVASSAHYVIQRLLEEPLQRFWGKTGARNSFLCPRKYLFFQLISSSGSYMATGIDQLERE